MVAPRYPGARAGHRAACSPAPALPAARTAAGRGPAARRTWGASRTPGDRVGPVPPAACRAGASRAGACRAVACRAVSRPADHHPVVAAHPPGARCRRSRSPGRAAVRRPPRRARVDGPDCAARRTRGSRPARPDRPGRAAHLDRPAGPGHRRGADPGSGTRAAGRTGGQRFGWDPPAPAGHRVGDRDTRRRRAGLGARLSVASDRRASDGLQAAPALTVARVLDRDAERRQLVAQPIGSRPVTVRPGGLPRGEQ